MTSHVILNIGLLAGDVEITPTAVYRAMRTAGILWEQVAFHHSDTEDTMVVEAFCTDHQVDLVATWLEQECIAVWDMIHWEGRLIGPHKSKWGSFDPDEFIMLSGCRLSAARSVA